MSVSASLTIEVEDLLDMARIMENGPTIVQRELLWGMEGGVTDLYGDIRDVTPRCRTGKLQESLQKNVTVSGKDITGEVKSLGSVAPYNHLVQDGRGPTVAKKGKALRIVFCDGRVIFRKKVGPSNPNPFMKTGLQKAQPGIITRFEQAEERIVRRLEGAA